ncbi:trypsin-like peptidase domain-containing protein [Aneurinibacillus sp. Ricciae_BoGa-3]|uniref:trypsin-like peptidase domain-containing protein n=1 Tax=Aneurinibacillus sp. Ricciae_BoGa-3 TaxID=3022697 RepID=UPI0023407BAD|nr:trypsin-like peptidase domain-containing protein [Aneurinibacillus sp. Ricciae_BoGa-3]WCK55622.1 trypsin-like peptidase domain-containing protein [Aneurinibacillus sp. Ricciae_BoGa-3]
MRYLVFLLLIFSLVCPKTGYASSVKTNLTLDGNVIYTNQTTFINNSGHAFVPVRTIANAIGASVEWSVVDKSVFISKEDVTIALKVGSTLLYKTDIPMTVEAPFLSTTNQIMVPVQPLSDSFWLTAKWNSDTKTIILSSKQLDVESVATNKNKIVLVMSTADDSSSNKFGSGFILTSNGEIVTNHHITTGSPNVIIKLSDGTVYTSQEVLYDDPIRDLTVLKINPAVSLPHVVLGDSSQLSDGQTVVSIGNPQGMEGTIGQGIISSVKRTIDGQSFIQITNPLSPGSSGGALFSLDSKVIGVTNGGLDDGEQINFAIPVNDLKNLLHNKPASISMPIVN